MLINNQHEFLKPLLCENEDRFGEIFVIGLFVMKFEIFNKNREEQI